MEDEKRDPTAGLSATTEYVQIFMINVSIEKASDLKKADIIGKSDPYCRVTALGQTYTTNTIMKTLDPVWNEKTTFVFFKDPVKLEFEVWDWDKGTKDDAIGNCELNLQNFFNQGHNGFTGSIPLQNVKKGNLFVSVSCRKLVPSDLEERAKKLAGETDQQKIDISNLDTNIANTQNNIEQLTNENENLTKNIETLKHDISETEQDIHAREMTQTELNEEFENIKKEKSMSDDKYEAAQTEMQNTKQDLNKMKTDLDKAKTENQHFTEQIQDLEKQLAAESNTTEEKKDSLKRPKSISRHKTTESTEVIELGPASLDDDDNPRAPNAKCCTILYTLYKN